MLAGALITESLRHDVTLEGLNLRVDRITRWRNPDPAPGQPDTWTIVDFASDRGDPDRLANQLAQALASPGWYVDFHTEDQKYVVFSGKPSSTAEPTPEAVPKPLPTPAR
ncbi:hypothetical protein ACWDV4_20850 [Micromonospora sp. NPDC003197]